MARVKYDLGAFDRPAWSAPPSRGKRRTLTITGKRGVLRLTFEWRPRITPRS
jgi:hypothetical protein